MERKDEIFDVIELGAVTVETQGDRGLPIEAGGLLPVTGLTDD